MPTGVYKRSEEYKKRMSETMKRIGNHPPLPKKGHIVSDEIRAKISKTLRGHSVSAISRHKIRQSHIGKKRSFESIKKFCKSVRGENHWNWKGGINPIHDSIRKAFQYKQWRQSVFMKDDFTCQECGKSSCYVYAHHTKSFSTLLKEAWDHFPLFNKYDAALQYTPLWLLENGMTLCGGCHKKVHKKRR